MRRFLSVAALLLALCLSACASAAAPAPARETPRAEPAEAPTVQQTPEPDAPAEEEEAMLQMLIGDTAVAVDWEENASVDALRQLCAEQPLTIELSMYGSFEQVGPLGASLPSSDVQTTTKAGDIVLYSGDQIVVFYGSNSWAYTRLGHIADQTAEELAALLGRRDVTLTLQTGEQG